MPHSGEERNRKGLLVVSLGNLANCTRCDALFVKTVRDICPKCYQIVEQEYEMVARFLRKRENRGATVQQVSEATGVSVRQITRFIKEGRISIVDNPNMGYPCENCGVLIRSGHLCDACTKELRREIGQQLDVDKRLAEERQMRSGSAAYQRKQNDDESF
jgi:flagellar operon protein (TIGR03826 family)